MSRQQPQFEKLPIAQASSRQKYAPTASDLSALLTAALRGAEQRAAILRTIVSNQPGLTPLPEIAKIAAMYPPRLKELRSALKGYGLTIQCYYELAVDHGRRSQHSWYRIERVSHPVPAVSSMVVPKTDSADSTLLSSPAISTMLAFETGRRLR